MDVVQFKKKIINLLEDALSHTILIRGESRKILSAFHEYLKKEATDEELEKIMKYL